MIEPIEPLQSAESEEDELPVLIIAGPSGSGKSTFVKMLLEDFSGQLGNPRAVTTRKPRMDGVDDSQRIYTDNDGFESMIAEGMMIGVITANNGNRYGFYRPDIDEIHSSGRSMILDMTSFAHVEIMRQYYPNLRLIAVSPLPEDQLDTVGGAFNPQALRDFFLPNLHTRAGVNIEEVEARIQGAVDFLQQLRVYRKDFVLVNSQENNLNEVYVELVNSAINLLANRLKRK